MRYVLLLFALLAFMAPAKADVCYTPDRVIADSPVVFPGFRGIAMDGAQTRAFVQRAKREGNGLQNMEGDLAITFLRADAVVARVVVFSGVCATQVWDIPIAIFVKITAGVKT